MRTPPLRSILQPDKDGKIDFRAIREWMKWFEDVATAAPTRGYGSPENVLTGSVGDLYCQLDGGAGTAFWIKESGTSTKTGWVNVGTLIGVEMTANKGAASGYAPLDAGSKVPVTNLPSASTSTTGVLSDTDWNTFNNKVSSQWTTGSGLIYYAGGNVGIGFTAPTFLLDVRSPSSTLVFNCQNAAGYGLYVNRNNTVNFHFGVAADDSVYLNYAGYNNAFAYFRDIFFCDGKGNLLIKLTASNGQQRWYTYGAGTLVTDANGNITASSDERLKNVQKDYKGGLAEIAAIQPIVFRWKTESKLDDKTDYIGFSAQEVQKKIPEAVGAGKDGMLTLSDRAIVAALVNAAKELSDRIDKLEKKAGK